MILLKGVTGPITVKGVAFGTTQMPPWQVLKDDQIANVLTFVRQSWGNTGGEITPQQIAAAREEFKDRSDPWTEKELLAVPANAELPGGASTQAAPAPGAAPAAPVAPK
jgi:hypothetical protein